MGIDELMLPTGGSSMVGLFGMGVWSPSESADVGLSLLQISGARGLINISLCRASCCH